MTSRSRGWVNFLALLSSAVALLVFPAAASPSPIQGEQVEGILTILNGDTDPARGGGAVRIHVLNADDGRRFELDLSGSGLPSPVGMDGMRVRATISPQWASPFGDAVRATVLEMRGLEAVSPLAVAKTVTGSQPFVSILCRFADDPNEPRPASFFQGQLGAASPGFNHYFREVSYGQINLDGSATSAGWVTLPQPRGYYLASGKPSSTFLDQLFKDCTNAAAGSIDFSKFYGINLMFNGQLDDAAWGGSSVHSLSGINKAWPATWMPYFGEANPFGWRNHSILAHEMAHAFGAPHSESPDGNEYGSSWDVVSSPGATCSVTDANYGCVGQSMNAYAKTVMQILPASRQVTAAVGSRTYTIERLEQPVGSGPVIVRVDIPGTNARFYTVESRSRVGYDAPLPGDGVIIHVVDTTRDRPARLVVPGGGTAAGLGAAAAIWPPGSTFTSVADNVSIRVNSFSEGTASVTVSAAIGAPAGYAPSDNVSGLWWNASESGWGINLNHQGATLFATLFSYASGSGSTNTPLWVVMPAGAQQADGSFQGAIYQTTGPAFNASPFTPIGASNLTQVGTMQLTFQSKSQATLSYTISEMNGQTITKQITPQAFGPLQSCRSVGNAAGTRAGRTNYTDLWWNAGESGWGVNVTHQGDTLFAALFTYEAGSGTSNRGTWFVMSAGARQSDGSYSGDLYQTTGPAFNANPFTPIGAANVTKVGTMTFRFSDGENGTLTYSVNGQTVQKAIVPQTFGTQLPSCS